MLYVEKMLSMFQSDDLDYIIPKEGSSKWVGSMCIPSSTQKSQLAPEQIVYIYDCFHRLGGPNGIIRQSEFFLYRGT